MDHERLLDAISKHFDEKTEVMRDDIGRLSNKLDGYQERLIKVESTLGFIKTGLSFVITGIGSIISYYFYKYIDRT